MKKYVHAGATWLLALSFIVFGLNKFLLFLPVQPPEGAIAQAFLGAMFTSYLAALVGAVEVTAGLLLLIKRTSFVGLLLLVPVVVNIALFHIAHDFVGNGIWLFSLALFAITAAFQKDKIVQLLHMYQK